MMNKRLKQGSTFLLALALAFPLLTLPGARAANAIKTDRKCSVAFNVSGEDNELTADGTNIKVNLYKVADVDVSGNYTATKDFTGLDVSSVRADNNDAASKWAERAKKAKEKLSDSVKPVDTVTLTGGIGNKDGLDTGLYEDYESAYAEKQEKLKKAGSEIVKEEIERQYKEWKDAQ